MQIYVHDARAKHCNHWAYIILIVALIGLTAGSMALAWRNSKPICNRVVKHSTQFEDTYVCEYDLASPNQDILKVSN